MDQKSQKNLSPELKAVYDRVMNTKISARPASPTDSKPTTSPQVSPEQHQVTPSSAAPTKPFLQTEVISETPSSTTPREVPQPIAQSTQEPVVPPQATPEPKPASAPDLSPIEPAAPEASDTFLSSLPPRPLNTMSDQPFVFTGGKTSASEPQKDEAKNDSKTEGDQKPQKSNSKVSSKIIMGLLFVFLVVYSLFWAKIFNIF